MTTAPLTAADRLEIAELFTRWGQAEDTGQAETWASLFTADGRCRNGRGDLITGHEALAENSRSRWARPDSRLAVHWMGEPVITPTETGARARHYAMLIERLEPSGYRVRSMSMRIYDVRRENGRWRIHDRDIARIPREDPASPA
jgi:hypothetical protein